MDFDFGNPSGCTDVLQEALGVTPAGKCLRHPNCPVLSMAQNKVVSCRICFSEEKSVGIQQRKNFAAVVNQLQSKVTLPEEITGDKIDSRWAEDEERRKAHQASMQSVLLYQSKQAQTLDSIMKRISQVQNWMVRQKEKEVLSLQLQIQRLEEKLDDSEVTVVEQTQTIRALRRTIQQDLKIIKTMSKAKDSSHKSDMSSNTNEEGRGSSCELTLSPLSLSSISPQKVKTAGSTSPPKYHNNRLQRQMDQLKRIAKSSDDEDDASAIMGIKKYQSVRNLSESTIPAPPGSAGSASGEPSTVETPSDNKAASYWNGDPNNSDAAKMFPSFRGGLLDIPRSPPPARHNDKPVRQKLSLASFERDALKVPETVAQKKISVAPLPLDMLNSAPLSPNSDVSGHSRTTPKEARGPPAVPKTKTSMPSLDLLGPPMDEDEEECIMPKMPIKEKTKEASSKKTVTTKKGSDENQEKYCFTVTGADCQDKYGEPGKYSGSLHALKNLPYGNGQMTYESGRIYSGDWVSGSWHGKGVLLNPNGDRYEGEFVLDSRHGHGTYYWENGDVYTGNFYEDKRRGHGKFSFHNGNVYEGEFIDGLFEGVGRYKFQGGYYDGEWKQGKYEGQGELKLASGVVYRGEFKDSLAHGFGTEITPNGKTRRGIWEHGQPVDQVDCV